MKKLVQINSVCSGSTGKIMCSIAKKVAKEGCEAYCFYGRGKPMKEIKCVKIESIITIFFHGIISRLGFNGHGSYFATNRLIRKLKKINPDVIHFHNIHGYYLNVKVLFNYLKKEYTGKIIWTLHDCWAFTGHCAYFTMVNCNKWKDCCYNCPQLKSYPREFFDTTKREYLLKKESFTGLKNLVIATPSEWLKALVKESFLGEYDTRVINNGIDLSVFKPTNDDSIYEKYNIPKDKKIILGVANIWEERKGLNIFLELSKMISKSEVIVLVGLNDKQLIDLPNNIIGIKRTENQNELACLYSICHVFLNPSVEETFSLVTAEAMACGAPVIVCGASAPKELIGKEDFIVNSNNAKEYYQRIKNVLRNTDKNKKRCLKYSNDKMINEYIDLYNN